MSTVIEVVVVAAALLGAAVDGVRVVRSAVRLCRRLRRPAVPDEAE